MITFFVARHGESTDDLSDSYGGASDFPLTDSGRDQAREMAKTLAGEGIQRIFSSPLRRATETAEIASGVLGLKDVDVRFDLRERNTYGLISGLTRAEAADIFGYLLERQVGNPGKDKTCFVGGEEYNEFIGRVGRVWAEILRECILEQLTRVLVVTHGKFTLGLFTEILLLGDSYDKGLGAVKVVEVVPPTFS